MHEVTQWREHCTCDAITTSSIS